MTHGLIEKNAETIKVKTSVLFFMIFSLILCKDVCCVSNYNLITDTEFPHLLSVWGCLFEEDIKLTSEN